MVVASVGGSEADASLVFRVVEACDFENPLTRGFAMDAARVGGAYSIEQVCNIFDAVNKPRWTYFSDPYSNPLGEHIAAASESIALGLRGDCDDFAVVLAATIRAIGGAARVALVYSPDGGGHAYAELYVGPSEAASSAAMAYIYSRYRIRGNVYFDTDGVGSIWLPLDWAASYPGAPPLQLPEPPSRILYAPAFSLSAYASGIPLPVPCAPSPEAGG